MSRIVIIGYPMAGKSTFAKTLGLPVFCTDPKSTVRQPDPEVTYMPEGIEWSKQSDYVIDQWFKKESFVIEGVGAVRALRKWASYYTLMPCDKIIFMQNKQPLDKHIAMVKSVQSIWGEIALMYRHITEYR